MQQSRWSDRSTNHPPPQLTKSKLFFAFMCVALFCRVLSTWISAGRVSSSSSCRWAPRSSSCATCCRPATATCCTKLRRTWAAGRRWTLPSAATSCNTCECKGEWGVLSCSYWTIGTTWRVQWCSPGYTQVYGVYPLIVQPALRIPTSQNRAFILCCMGCFKKIAKLRVYPLLQGPLHHCSCQLAWLWTILALWLYLTGYGARSHAVPL